MPDSLCKGDDMDTLRIYFKLVGMALKSMTQFRVDFLVGVAGVIVQNGVNLLAIGVILGRFHDLAGWTVWEIVFLYGIWMVGNSLYSLLFLHLSSLDRYIIEGTFDRFLVHPLSPFLQLLGEDVNMNGVADVVFGLACLALSMTNLGLAFNPLQWAFLCVVLLSAALIELGITLFFASTAFWTGHSTALINTVNQVNWNMTQQYPLEMFGRGFRVFVTCFIPVAFINYYPARWLLGKITPGDPGYFLSFLSPLVALLLLSAACLVWAKGLRQYTSTGS
jgi:ABC-2 type transport system permease protein